MAAGLAALLDDVAVLARAAAASIDDIGAAAARASGKAAGVVVDDTAVTPQYVHGLAAERELPIIWRIAKGSLRNKLLILLPAVLLLSQFLPVLLTPLLMLGAAYLCYEGAEKLWEKVSGGHHDDHGAVEETMIDEDTVVSGAVRTDFILSAEIIVIALNEVVDEPFVSRALILAVVAVGITVMVYGVVGLIVKMDDVGLSLSQRPGKGVARLGRGLVKAMPRLLAVLTVVGTAAMLWVGGHILLVGTDDLGLHVLYDVVHHLEEAAAEATGALGSVVGWLVNTLGSALLGLLVGALIVLVGSFTWHRRKAEHGATEHGTPEDGTPEHGTPEDGTPEDGTPEDGAAERGTPEHGAGEHGAAEHGTGEHGTGEHGTGEHDTTEGREAEPRKAEH